MKFDNLEVGMVLFDVRSYKMGNTTMRTVGVWAVQIMEIDAERRSVLASWNGNPAQWHNESWASKLKEKEPVLIRTAMGGRRRPNREELAEIRANKKAEKRAAKGEEFLAQGVK